MRFGWVFWVFCVVEAILVGMLVGSFTVWNVDPVLAPLGAVEFFIYRYQTMLAAVVALGTAAVGARAIFVQMRHAEQLAADARERRMDGARAMMPLALSQIVSYADASAQTVNQLRAQCVVHLMPKPTLIPPEVTAFPDAALQTLRDAIENGNSELSGDVSLLLARLQVQRARVAEVVDQALGKGRAGHSVFDLNLETYIIDSAEIYARSSALFDYARRLSAHTTKIDNQAVERSLNLLGFDDFTDDGMYERVRSRTSWGIVPA